MSSVLDTTARQKCTAVVTMARIVAAILSVCCALVMRLVWRSRGLVYLFKVLVIFFCFRFLCFFVLFGFCFLCFRVLKKDKVLKWLCCVAGRVVRMAQQGVFLCSACRDDIGVGAVTSVKFTFFGSAKLPPLPELTHAEAAFLAVVHDVDYRAGAVGRLPTALFKSLDEKNVVNFWLAETRLHLLKEIDKQEHWDSKRRITEIAVLISPALKTIWEEAVAAAKNEPQFENKFLFTVHGLMTAEMAVLFIIAYSIQENEYFKSENEEAKARNNRKEAIEKHKRDLIKQHKNDKGVVELINDNPIVASLSYYCVQGNPHDNRMEGWKTRVEGMINSAKQQRSL